MSSLVIELEQSTPALVGHYEPGLVDELNFLRPTSVKGVWRWFARALVSGALYDLGLLCGEPGDDVVKRPTAQEINTISRIVGNEMGLGYAGGRGKGTASRFRLRVEVENNPNVDSTEQPIIALKDGTKVKLQRLGLLTIEGWPVQYFEGGTFRLVVERAPGAPREDREGEELALRALLLALSLSGVGKASRKGLGSLDIVTVEGLNVGDNLRSFLEETHKIAIQFVEQHADIKACESQSLPPVPSITKKQAMSMPSFSLYRVEKADWVSIHNFFLRSDRCFKLMRKYRCRDKLREKLEAWILGLPRSQLLRQKSQERYKPEQLIKTGYFIQGTANRRASPILVTYHGEENTFGKGAFVSAFASADWPAKLEWFSYRPKEKQKPRSQQQKSQPLVIREEKIIEALRDALDELWKCIRMSPSKVWP
jgi:CRISPR-associated protein Cmr1